MFITVYCVLPHKSIVNACNKLIIMIDYLFMKERVTPVTGAMSLSLVFKFRWKGN